MSRLGISALAIKVGSSDLIHSTVSTPKVIRLSYTLLPGLRSLGTRKK